MSDSPPAKPAPPVRKQSLNPAAVEALEQRLQARPEKTELVDRNILKDDTVAPALQAAKAKLLRSQLEDKLDRALQARPQAKELVNEGILHEDEVPTPIS